MVSGCTSFTLYTTCASLTHTSRQNPKTRFPGTIHAQRIGTSWTWSWPGALYSRTYYSPECGLRYKPFSSVLQDQDAAEEIPPCQTASPPPWHKQVAQNRTREAVVCHLRKGTWNLAIQSVFNTELGRAVKHHVLHSPGHFGKKNSKCHDWFGAKSFESTPIIAAKRAALSEYKTPHEKNLQTQGAMFNRRDPAQWRHPDCCHHKEDQRNVRWHQEGTWSSPD